MPVPTAKPLIVPLVAVISPAANPTGTSLKVKVISAVWPAFKVLAPLVMASVGATVSTVIDTLLLLSAPSTLKLPAVSLNLALATLTVAAVVLALVGVNKAV